MEGLCSIANRAIKYLDKGVELKTIEINIKSRKDAELIFGIASIRSNIRKIISEKSYVTPNGYFSSSAASRFLSEKSFL